jgi:hypothetical protein
MKPNKETPRKARLANSGAVVSVCGSVVDVRFDRQLPAIYTVLRTGAEKQIVIEGLSQLDANRVRGIALTAHARPRPRHAGGKHGRAITGAGWQGHSFAYARRKETVHRGGTRTPEFS